MKCFGQKMRFLRKSHHLTLVQLAERLQYNSHTFLSEIERGKKMPTTELVLKIARLFDVTTDQLLKDELDLSRERESVNGEAAINDPFN